MYRNEELLKTAKELGVTLEQLLRRAKAINIETKNEYTPTPMSKVTGGR